MADVTPLPIDSHLPRIIAALRAARALVLVAEPGAGKTTRVPPAILAAGLLDKDHPNLVMLQPRRVAARAAAARIAEENGWELGRQVGYHVRFDRRIGPHTRLRVLTEGILTRQLLDDPFLDGIGAVVLDEFHERGLHTDLAVAMLREVRQTVRQDLLLVVMSATLEAEPVARFLGDCPIVTAGGRTFPVRVIHESGGGPVVAAPRAIGAAAAAAVRAAIGASDDDGGDVLVFLPGAGEIRAAGDQLAGDAKKLGLALIPLYGALPPAEQLRALQPAPPGLRKIVLATNIAETSLTIDGVTTVIDTGLARVPGYDPRRGLDRLELSRISQASAAQRAGRAGRTAPGRCVRLWSLREHQAMEAFDVPEVRRVDLSATVLSLHAWGKSQPQEFGWFEAPAEKSLAAAERLLTILGAIRQGKLTDVGRRLAALPVHPRLGRLLLASGDAGALESGAALAALMQERDIFIEDFSGGRGPAGNVPNLRSSSDLLLRLDALDGGQAVAEVDPIALRQVGQTRDELYRLMSGLFRSRGRGDERGARRKGAVVGVAHPTGARSRGAAGTVGTSVGSQAAKEESALLRLILLAYPDRVCRRREHDPAAAVMVGGGGVRLGAACTVRDGEFFVAVDARNDPASPKAEARVRIASRIESSWLAELFPDLIRQERAIEFDAKRQAVIGRTTSWFLDLPIREQQDAPVDEREAGRILAAALRPRAAEIFRADAAAAAMLARIEFLARHMAEHPWPAVDEAKLGDLLEQACEGKRRVDQLTGAVLAGAIYAALPPSLDRILRDQAPETIVVPSGSRIAMEYSSGKAPRLSVRLQEVFGWSQTPRIAGGRVAVVLELLAPNFRPVQVTDDLNSFFANAYYQVRKDLKRRYPKHSWPDDPFTAAPQAKGGRRQRQ